MGGVSTGSMVKHLQQHDDAQNLKIAFISEQNKFIEPTNYFPIVHGHQNDQKAESYTIQAVIDKWSKLEISNPVTSINAEGNSLTLENGKEFTYKSLVMAPGLNHSMEGIKGLAELADEDDQTNGVNVHMLSNKDRISRNYWGGWHHPAGDFICYSPAAPYKGEGSDFYALYYEHFMRYTRCTDVPPTLLACNTGLPTSTSMNSDMLTRLLLTSAQSVTLMLCSDGK